MSLKTIIAAGFAALALGACVAVSDVDAGADLYQINEMAIQTCGGPSQVKLVNEDGFECHDGSR